MKRLSTFVCALALLLVGGTTSVKAELVYKVVYSDLTSFPWYVMGFTPTFENGAMVDDGASGWHQYFIADGIPTVKGNDYVVKALVKSSANLTFNINMGDWDHNVDASVTIPQSDVFVEVEWKYKNMPATSCHIVAQPWSNPKIEWKELAVYTADAEYNKSYGELEVVSPTLYAKNYGGGTDIATPDGDGVYTITDAAGSGDTWATQFWIVAPNSLPAGQKFYVEFKYKADAAGTVGTQTHGATPGSYITHHCIGDVEFGTGWKTFTKEVTIEADMNGWQSIAFNLHLNSDTKYYLKDIVLKEPEVTGEVVNFCVGSAGWATYSSSYNVSLGSVKGYAAKAHGSYVQLIPVTEVPANNAVLIEGAGKYSFDVVTSAAAIADNDLQISNGSVTGDGSTIYALGKKGGVVGFVKVKNGTKIPKGKAYIEITGSGARDFIGFDEETTGVNEVRGQKEDVRSEYFNLAGQRVAQPTKGLYIVNGKKVIIK